MDTAALLKRFFFCERSLLISQGAWLAALAPFEVKTTLPRFGWEMALAAHGLRERVLELRYPNRLLEIGADQALIACFDEARQAPTAEAFFMGWRRCCCRPYWRPMLSTSRRPTRWPIEPSLRIVRSALADQAQAQAVMARWVEQLLGQHPSRRPAAEQWAAALAHRLRAIGGVALVKPPSPAGSVEIPGPRAVVLPGLPARDAQFHLCRFYWPDIINAAFPYGAGVRLQLRSAVSHVNEVWAIEFGGALLLDWADELPWEFLFDAARWTYDESRHARMGYARLEAWGYQPAEIPLGTYIFDAARGEDPLIRLAMLHYFETKNIGQKSVRAATFAAYADTLSQHDMEFDWADETLHAHYGRRWLAALRTRHPERVPPAAVLNERCAQLVAAQVATATDADHADIRQVAEAMIANGRTPGRAVCARGVMNGPGALTAGVWRARLAHNTLPPGYAVLVGFQEFFSVSGTQAVRERSK